MCSDITACMETLENTECSLSDHYRVKENTRTSVQHKVKITWKGHTAPHNLKGNVVHRN